MIKKLLFLTSIILVFKVSGATNYSANFIIGTPPTIFNFRIEASQPNRIYFDSDKVLRGSNTNGFTVSNKSISGITINEGQLSNHYFTISSSLNYWDNSTIRYEGGSDIKDQNGNDLIEFTLSYVKNRIPEPQATNDRYVTTSARGGGNGTSESSAWTLKEAFSNATAGMTVWIKAGNYGNQNLSLYNDGTSMSPIKFIGYRNYKGDITSNYYDYGVTWDTSKMPTLTGVSPNSGTGIMLMGTNYIVIRNIQITNYYTGIKANNTYNSNIVFDRINGHTFLSTGGSFIALTTYNRSTKRPVSNNNLKLVDSRGVNASMGSAILFGEGNNLIDGFKSYNDNTGKVPRTDYHIAINGHNNIVRNSYVENFNNTETNTSTHGITIRGFSSKSSTYNLIELSKAVNNQEGFAIRNYGSNYNVIKDCEVSNNGAKTYDDRGGVWIWGGSNYNTIERVIIDDVDFGIGFTDNQEEDGNDTSIGHNNIIRNCIVKNSKYAVYASTESYNSLMRDNKIINCTFDNNKHFFRQGSAQVIIDNLEIINSSISNTGSPVRGSNLNKFKFTNNNFYNLKNWSKPPGTGNTSEDPKYINAAGGNFRLSENSPLIDAGKNLKEVSSDYDKNFRPQGTSTDIGAFEFEDEIIGAINLEVSDDLEICKGSETTLTASGNGSFLWSTGETSASIIVSPEVTTTYSVTASSDSASESADIKVTVTEGPAVTLGDDINSCAGNEITITAEGNGSFLWSNGETTPSITVSPSETTEYIVTSSSVCGSETLSVSDTLIVNIAPAINLNAGDDVAVCSGTEVTLTAEGDGTFLWNTGETTASISVTPTETTTYTVTSGLGDCEVTDEVIVTISEQPQVTLGEDIIICSGNEITITAEGNGEFLWNNGETAQSITVSPTETTEYIVTASSVCGEETLSVSDTLVVNVTPGTNLNAGNDVTVCSGTEVTLTAESNGTFLWNTGETTASITVNPTETTTYSVTSGSGECEITDEVIVTITEQPEVTLGDDVSICSGNEITLTAEGKGNYLWSTGETTASILVNPTETTEYVVTSSSVCGGETLIVSDTLVVNVIPGITLNAGNDIAVCSGTEVVLTAEGNGTFLWSTGETTASITVNPNETTTYSVTSGSGECEITDEVMVTISEQPQVSLGEDVSICSGNELTLTAQGNGDFLWSTGETTTSIKVNPTETTEYTVISSSVCGGETISVSDTLVVNVAQSIILNAGEDVSICSGTDVILTAEGNGTFLWSTGETTASITVNPNETTTYSVTSGSGNCEVTDEVLVTVADAPSVSLGADVSICSGVEVTLTAEGTGTFLWSTGETTASINVNPSETSEFTVTSSTTCGNEIVSASDSIIVNVTPSVNLSVSEDVFICIGNETTLVAEGNGDFLWSTGETTASIIVSPSETTEYTVVSGTGDCVVNEKVIVTVENLPNVKLGDDLNICFGEFVTIVAEGNGDFLWSNGEMGPSIRVNPSETITYSVSATNSCGITVTDDIKVNVGSEVFVDAGEDVTICNGDAITLTAEGNGDFLWSTGETSASITVSPDSPTEYWVTSTINDCSQFDEVLVVVETAPSVRLGEDVSICPGEMITLVAEGFGNFLWSTGETTSSILVSPEDTTTYTVTATSSCGDMEIVDDITVKVNEPIFADAGDSIVIELGQSIQLTATGGDTFLWSTGETSESIMVQPTTTTIYTVEVSNEGYNCSDIDSVEVGVVNNDTSDAESVSGDLTINSGAEEITICKGDEITLTAKGALHYLWNTKNTSSSITISPQETETYHVSALRNGILETTEVTIIVRDCSTNRAAEFNLYPNPTNGIINVHIPSQKAKLKIQVVSLNGKLVYSKQVKADRNGVFTQIDLSLFAKGVYLLKMLGDDFKETKKILVI